MTTLTARWEKPDYTGVTAEVPLGHIPHPKNRPNDLQFSQVCLFPGFTWFWAIYSPVIGTPRWRKLAEFLLL
jgi:hypothetical protein